ncbi:MAG: cysteine desulfurase family protein [Thermoguttaceae bacterium]|jgi:cysteine desulfurase
MQSIYLDHNATTPTRPEVVEAMIRSQRSGYANPASQHRPGQEAHALLENARERIAEILGGCLTGPQPDRLIFTSGGTEANNLAVLGIAQARSRTPGRLLISAIEHASVIGPAEHLLEQGWRLDTLSVTDQGVLRLDLAPGLLDARTALVSVMLGNHETGVLQPIGAIAALCNAAGVPLHCDAVAAVGKVPVDFRRLGLAAMTIAAHKFQGPLGIGALLLRHDVSLTPLCFGGHQQFGLRPGTESVALAIGLQTALELWQQEQTAHAARLTALRDRLEQGLSAACLGVVVHGRGADRLPHTSNVAFPGLDGQILLLALDMAGVACSVGAACASGSTELSPTLRAMNVPNHLAASSLRFSVGATNDEAEIDEAVRRIAHVSSELRGG